MQIPEPKLLISVCSRVRISGRATPQRKQWGGNPAGAVVKHQQTLWRTAAVEAGGVRMTFAQGGFVSNKIRTVP